MAHPAQDVSTDSPTDDEIFADLDFFNYPPYLLRVAKKYTNTELHEKVTLAHGYEAISYGFVGNKIRQAIAAEAADQGRRRDDVDREFREAREANGVPERQMLARAASTAAAKEIAQSMIDRGDADENTQQHITGPNVTPISREERIKQLREECEQLLREDVKLLQHERLLKIASIFTKKQILDKVNRGLNKQILLKDNQLDYRMQKAYSHSAKSTGRSIEEVKACLDVARERNDFYIVSTDDAASSEEASHVATTTSNSLFVEDDEPNAQMEDEDSDGAEASQEFFEDAIGDLCNTSRGGSHDPGFQWPQMDGF